MVRQRYYNERSSYPKFLSPCMLLAVRSVEVGCANSITAASIEPGLAQLQTTFQLDEKYCTAKWVNYLRRKIVRNSVLHIPCAEGPLFYLTYEIIINNMSSFVQDMRCN